MNVFIHPHYNNNTYMGPFHDMPPGRLPQQFEPRAFFWWGGWGVAIAIAMVLERMLTYREYTELKTFHSFIQVHL